MDEREKYKKKIEKLYKQTDIEDLVKKYKLSHDRKIKKLKLDDEDKIVEYFTDTEDVRMTGHKYRRTSKFIISLLTKKGLL